MEEKANVVVMGASGAGKSTLINAIMNSNARVNNGEAGTSDLSIYERDEIPFRLIDTVGLEPGVFEQRSAIHKVQEWSKKSIKSEDEKKQIHLIWYCVDAMSKRLFGKHIKMMMKATQIWKDVPIIVVMTKSYSKKEIKENDAMVRKVFSRFPDMESRLKAVIPVVAKEIEIDDGIIIEARGINDELVPVTVDNISYGIKASKEAIKEYQLKLKRYLAGAIVGSSTTAAAVVGAVPIPFADAALLGPLEMGMLTGIRKVYNIPKEESNAMLNVLIETGTVGVAAKTAISGIKAIPGINLAAGFVNAVMAAIIVATIGGVSSQIMEQVHLGKKSISDIDWAKKIAESEIAKTVLPKAKELIEEISNKGVKNREELVELIKEILKKK